MARASNTAEQDLLSRLDGYDVALEATRAALRVALSTGSTTGTLHVRRHLQRLVQIVRDAVSETIENPIPSSAAVPDLRTFLAELKQLGDDFESVDVDCRARTITATAKPITLEGVYLGPFAIRLNWDRLLHSATSHCFVIDALEPHPAAANAEVTHPHVSHEELCAGDASRPLEHALEQGRLADAFCLVHRVLETYNPRSAHIVLDSWGGSECHRCGRNVADDDSWRCDGCDREVCSDCSTDCEHCHSIYCRACLFDCERCETTHCENCTSSHTESCADEADEAMDPVAPEVPAPQAIGVAAPAHSNDLSTLEKNHEPSELIPL